MNGDGLDDNYDRGPLGPGSGIGLGTVNTDLGLPFAERDALPDYRDTDSDNDGLEDAAERGTAGPLEAQHGVLSDPTNDADGDGLLDVFEGSNINDAFDVNDENVDVNGEFTLADLDEDVEVGRGNAVPLLVDVEFRDVFNSSPTIDLNGAEDGTDYDELFVEDSLLFLASACLLYTSPSPRD